MHRDTFSIGLACALGGTIGAFMALEIAATFALGWLFWPVGAVLGGLVGYCAVDYQELGAGIARSYRQTTAWRPDWKVIRRTLYSMLTSAAGFLALWSTAVLATFAMFLLVEWGLLMKDSGFPPIIPELLVVSMVFGTFLASVFMGPLLTRSTEVDRKVLRHLNPFSAAAYLVYFGVKALWQVLKGMHWLAVRTPAFLRTARAFVWQAFVYVHSARRMICLVDATIGTAIGYFAGSVTIGAVAGAVLGAVNYEIVAIRWLKLVPAKK